ncbi:MAG: helix-turn-helix domain-containing protein [Clostridia bacterium]|nr:helix-turn-helix domain-containing protein [Clostridia bacterium]
MVHQYIQTTDRVFFKHEISEDLPCDAYSMHTHNAYELIYFLDGDASHVIEDRKYKLKRGDLILIRPMSYHFIRIEGQARYERYDILFDPKAHGVEGVELIPEGLEVVSLAGNPLAEDVFRRCDAYRLSCSEEVFSRLLPHLLSELFLNLHTAGDMNPTAEGAKLSPLISEFLGYVNRHLCSPLDIGQIADSLYVSESYLFRLFKRELHQTPLKYIREKRLMLARKMLSEGERSTAVCTRCGFSDYTTFYRNYVGFFGCAPSERDAVHILP